MRELKELQGLMTKDYPNTIELIFMIDFIKNGKKGLQYDLFISQLNNKKKQSEKEIDNILKSLEINI